MMTQQKQRSRISGLKYRVLASLGTLLMLFSFSGVFLFQEASVALAAGTISGHVFYYSKAPVVGATVQIRAANGQGGVAASTTTASDGSYNLSVSAGTWTVHVLTGQDYYGYDLVTITLSDGQTVSNQDFYVGPRDVATITPTTMTQVPATPLPTSTVVSTATPMNTPTPMATSTNVPNTPMPTQSPPQMPKTGAGGNSQTGPLAGWLLLASLLGAFFLTLGVVGAYRRSHN